VAKKKKTAVDESGEYENLVADSETFLKDKEPPPEQELVPLYPHQLTVKLDSKKDCEKFAQLLGRSLFAKKPSFVFSNNSRTKPENWKFVENRKNPTARKPRKMAVEEQYWTNMVEFKNDAVQPYMSFELTFKSKDQYSAFARLVQRKLDETVSSMWFPNKGKRKTTHHWSSSWDNVNPHYPVYIISKGRAHCSYTANALDRLDVPHFVVIEPQDYDAYSCVMPEDRLLVLPFSNHGDGPGRARNWCWDHAVSLGAKRHWVMDDNIEAFYRLHENRRIRVNDGGIFRAAEDFVDRYSNVPVSGFHYRFYAMPDEYRPPFILNTRIYSCLLIENSCKHRWRGRWNEDTILSLDVLKDGDCVIQFNAFLQGKMATQVLSGGNTEEFYAKDGTYNKSAMLEAIHPDVAKVVYRYGRWHHHVDYSPFKNNKLKPVKKHKSGIEAYPMELVEIGKEKEPKVPDRSTFPKPEILMPIMTSGAYDGEDQKIITGGIEMFSKNLVDMFPQIRPVYVSKEMRKAKRTNNIIWNAVAERSPDIILINDPWTYRHVKKYDVPKILIFHTGMERDPRMLSLGDIFNEMIDDGVHIYAVSKKQFSFHKDLVKRTSNFKIGEKDIKGFISPSFCQGTKFVKRSKYDCATVGRAERLKDPFVLHWLANGTGLQTLVMTNEETYVSEHQNAYVKKNADWKDPQKTAWNLDHSEVIKRLSHAKMFLSTCPEESWGITAMEALGCGVPAILLTDKTGKHASEDIAADPSHYRKIKKKNAKKEFLKVVEELKAMPTSKRREIYEMTNKKHSEENWKKMFVDMFALRLKDS
jgi:hypothetical protein